jgi:hypothetical protein
MASMSAGDLAIVVKEVDKLLDKARKNEHRLSEASYGALSHLLTATAITYT